MLTYIGCSIILFLVLAPQFAAFTERDLKRK